MVTAALLLLAAQATMPPASPQVAVAAKALNAAEWITADDYPPTALRAREQGRVTVRFTVDTAGAVRDCAVTASSLSVALDTHTCDVLTRRARFAPARDAAGRPIATLMSRSIIWVLPDPEPEPVIAHRSEMHITLNRGRVAVCSQREDGNRVAADMEGCGTFASTALLQAAFGSDLMRTKAVDMVVAMLPGDPPAPLIGDGETRIVIAQALFTIGADHHIAHCSARVANILSEWPFDFCTSRANDPQQTFTGVETTFQMTIEATAKLTPR